jgi:hypothetical protein
MGKAYGAGQAVVTVEGLTEAELRASDVPLSACAIRDPRQDLHRVDADTFLLNDYQSKVGYLSEHMGRVWTRFNFFLTVQSGLVAGLVFASDEGTFTASALWFLIAEAVLSVVWWVFGAQDRWLIALYRDQIEQSWELLRKHVIAELPSDYPHTGQTENQPKHSYENAVEWRSERFSITHLPALVPLLLLVVWLALIVVYVFTQ